MKLSITKLFINMQSLMLREEGQDLVEYALVVALIALAATTGMNGMASAIGNAFTNISTLLTTALA